MAHTPPGMKSSFHYVIQYQCPNAPLLSQTSPSINRVSSGPLGNRNSNGVRDAKSLRERMQDWAGTASDHATEPTQTEEVKEA
jgi:hypothetical protein